MSSETPSRKRTTKQNPPDIPPPASPGGMERAVRFWLHFGRFGWDVLGVLILVSALLTLIGLLGLTHGALIDWWTGLLWTGLGWGSYLIVGLLALMGLVVMRQGGESSHKDLSLGQILSLEGTVFCALAILSFWGGISLERAETGLDGGVVGWGLAKLLDLLLPAPLGVLLAVILGLIWLFNGLGLTRRIRQRLDAWLLDGDSPEPVEGIVEEVDLTTEARAPEKTRTARVRERKPSSMPAAENVAVYPRDERLPPLNLLVRENNTELNEEQIQETAGRIVRTLAEFGIPAHVAGYRVGPTVTQFAVEPGFVEKEAPDGSIIKQKVRVSQISNLSRDLALALSAQRLRIVAPVPGRSYVGVEVPNPTSSMVYLRSILESEALHRLGSPLAIALGRDVSGQPVAADLSRMPHLLIAGTTGSGKSVCMAAITTCLIMNNTPGDLRIAMLDPKMVELVRFNGLPHLLGRVETDIERMLGVLRWAITEMEHRYRLFEEHRVRDLESFNRKMQRRKESPLPRIVVMIDELADLMMSAPDQTEHSLVRLAQMARATGIHLVVATQRPSTEVVTGLIKANFPARVAFTVASSIDSRVILDTNGAETLLGKGDMLFLNPEVGALQRAQGVYVTDPEVERVIAFWQKMSPVSEPEAPPWEDLLSDEAEPGDDLVEQAVKIVRQSQRANASMLQRRLRIGYPRAARLIDELEALGVVGPSQGMGREREVLVPPEDEDEEETGGSAE